MIITIGGSLIDKPERDKHRVFLADNGIGKRRAPATEHVMTQ
ncbi:MAG: hypothetical protein ACRDRN_01655 [Sciscionella sp.]